MGVKVEFFILRGYYRKNAPAKAITIFGYARGGGPSGTRMNGAQNWDRKLLKSSQLQGK